MGEERKQSPHYIPELDPDNPESGPKVKQRILWFCFLVGAACILSGGGLVAVGMNAAGIIMIGVGLVLLSPLLITFPWF